VAAKQALFSANKPDIRESDNNQWLPAANQRPTCLVVSIPSDILLFAHSPYYFLLNAILNVRAISLVIIKATVDVFLKGIRPT